MVFAVIGSLALLKTLLFVAPDILRSFFSIFFFKFTLRVDNGLNLVVLPVATYFNKNISSSATYCSVNYEIVNKNATTKTHIKIKRT